MYASDRGIDELEERRGNETVTVSWVAARLREYVDIHPEHDVAVDRLATWLARRDDEDDD